jgi:hypothetical protein
MLPPSTIRPPRIPIIASRMPPTLAISMKYAPVLAPS